MGPGGEEDFPTPSPYEEVEGKPFIFENVV